MNFFQWSSLIRMLVDTALTADGDAVFVLRSEWLLGVVIGGAIFLGLTVLGGFGLLKMAKNQGRRDGFLGFIPIVNTWYVGVLAGETKVFGKTMKRAGLYAALLEGVCVAVGIFGLVLELMLTSYAQAEVYLEVGSRSLYTYYIDPQLVPDGFQWAYGAVYGYTALNIGWLMGVSDLLAIAFVVFECILYTAFFRKYNPRSAIAMTALAVLFPVREILFFCFRNRTPMDYGEYLRKRREAYARAYGYNVPPAPEDSPFGDFSDSKPKQDDEPFDEFK